MEKMEDIDALFFSGGAMKCISILGVYNIYLKKI